MPIDFSKFILRPTKEAFREIVLDLVNVLVYELLDEVILLLFLLELLSLLPFPLLDLLFLLDLEELLFLNPELVHLGGRVRSGWVVVGTSRRC